MPGDDLHAPSDVPSGVPSDVPFDVEAMLALAESAAREAGDLIRAEEALRDQARPTVDATKSSPTDVVTATDRAVESLLRGRIAKERPGDGLLGEEDGQQPGSSRVTWVLDPIDGTVNFLYRLPVYAVSVAAVAGDPRVEGRWRPLAGCVHNPVTGETWTAAAGAGAWLDGRRLRLPPPPDLDKALVGTGFGYRAERRRAQAEVLADVLPRVRDIRRYGSASIDLCMVAVGQMDAYYETGLHVWDLAAAALVVTEAGGVIRGLGERPPGSAMVVAAGPGLVDDLADLLSEVGAERVDDT